MSLNKNRLTNRRTRDLQRLGPTRRPIKSIEAESWPVPRNKLRAELSAYYKKRKN
ncbi:unnamed protein product [marine sediment metagenome]|uniref:Uncharacterized protein n=1 Tax=marine sediment metagenome TaxID=412755 RepID=X1LHD6_9ZZZZ